MLPEHPLGAERVAAFDAAWAAMPKGKPAPPPPPPIELALPGGHSWKIRRQPDQRLLDAWRRSLGKEGATPKTWHLLFQAFDGGWTLSQPPPAAMKSLRGWNRVPESVVAAMVEYLASEAVGELNARGLDG